VASRVRKLREAAGLTQVELCRLSGVTRPTLYVAEASTKRVHLQTLVKLARALGVTIADIDPKRAAELSGVA
jgi:transcriptional regulator with XRE-family HTH domain